MTKTICHRWGTVAHRCEPPRTPGSTKTEEHLAGYGQFSSPRNHCFYRRSSVPHLWQKSLAALCVLSVLCGSLAFSADSPADLLSPRLDPAIAKGLAFLASQQKPSGAVDAGGPPLAMTGLSLMSFLSAGYAPGQGKFGAAVTGAIDYLVAQAPDDGYFGKVDGSRMYGHGIITLALAEAYGVEKGKDRRAKLRRVLDRAVKVILDAQQVKKDPNNAGGWRYEPGSGDSDLSLSGWCALALRAASNAGVNVPKDRVQRAVQYVLKCYRADQKGFAYQPNNEISPPMTGVGVLNLYLLDAADRPEAMIASKTLTEKLINVQTRFQYYALYYTTQAAYQAGENIWPTVWKVNQDQLLDQQQPDGGWPQSRTGEEPGRVYATAMSVLTLTVPYRLLPIYQR